LVEDVGTQPRKSEHSEAFKHPSTQRTDVYDR
jgi:hypothetical protein